MRRHTWEGVGERNFTIMAGECTDGYRWREMWVKGRQPVHWYMGKDEGGVNAKRWSKNGIRSVCASSALHMSPSSATAKRSNIKRAKYQSWWCPH